jgi:hypothetical protein
MRNVILGLGISLDGYIARPDGTLDFLFRPKDYSMTPFFESVDAAILGRKTYDDGLKMGGSFAGWSMEFYVLSKSQLFPSGFSSARFPAGRKQNLLQGFDLAQIQTLPRSVRVSESQTAHCLLMHAAPKSPTTRAAPVRERSAQICEQRSAHFSL